MTKNIIMHQMKRVAYRTAGAVLLAAGVVSWAFAAEPDFMANAANHKPPFKIGVSNGYIGNTWRAQFVGDIESVAKELKSDGDIASVTVLNSTSGVSGQLNQINSLINTGVDALVINPESNEAMKPVIERALAAGILVVIADNPLAIPGVLSVTLDQDIYGSVNAQWMVDQLKGKGEIVSIDGIAGVTGNDLRIQARDRVLKSNPGITLLASVPGGWDQAKAREVMGTLLTAHPNIDGVLIQDVMAEGVIRAYEAAGKPLPPMSGDYLHSYLKLWKTKPNLRAVVVSNPPGIGGSTLRFAVALLRGQRLNVEALKPSPVNPKIVNTVLVPEPIVITREPETNKPWCTVSTECIGLDEALKRLDGQPDSAALDSVMTQKQVLDRYFNK